MPRQKSFKTVVLELVMYIGIISVVGHICENLFQRIMMHNALVNMKSDLNSLQLYINSLEMAYDSLRDEFQDLTSPTKKAKKHTLREIPSIKSSDEAYLSRNSVIEALYKELINAKSSFVQTTNDFMQNFQRSVKDFSPEFKIPAKDSSTDERHIKCILDDSRDPDMKHCKCIIKCSSDLSEPEKMENEALLTESRPSVEQHEQESTANVTVTGNSEQQPVTSMVPIIS